MSESIRKTGTMKESKDVEAMPGISRTTLAYCAETMLCIFKLKKGAEIPLHNHPAAQTGYVVKGEVLFKREGGSEFTALPGTGYVFLPNERHAATAVQDSEIVEVFAPMRPEYV